MPLIKICGLRRRADIDIVNKYKPDFIGFIFAEGRARTITRELAEDLKKALAPEIKAVGVFVNQDREYIAELLKSGIIDLAQLHGNEEDEDVCYIKKITGKPVIKAVSVKTSADIEKYRNSSADYLLLDNGIGGTGQTFDWNEIKSVGKSFFLAGGIDINNVAEAMTKGALVIDVSGGVETEGFKDEEKIRELIKKIRGEKNMSNMSKGRFGVHGGQYVPETLMNAIIELEEAYEHYKKDEAFNKELEELLKNYAGRPSLLYYAERMTKDLGGAKIYLKREDLNHTGAHKINNVLGQVLLAKKMGKTRVIAETGAGQHGVATATAAALMDMECEIYMGEEDTIRQALNVYRMRLLGAKVHPVKTGTATLKDAVSEAMREWTNRIDDTHYVLGSVMGPHPFPTIVRDYQAVISKEIKEQMLELEGRLPDAVLACVGGGSNAIGTFYNFIGDKEVRLIGCEAAGRGINTAETAATIATGKLGIFHGMKSYFCQDEYGQIAPVYSISAGLDYPGIGPEHANLYDTGRAEYVAITDDEAVEAFEYLSRMEGIIPAIESSHAIAHAMKLAPTLDKDKIIVVTVSGRGDKDCAAIARYRGEDIHE